MVVLSARGPGKVTVVGSDGGALEIGTRPGYRGALYLTKAGTSKLAMGLPRPVTRSNPGPALVRLSPIVISWKCVAGSLYSAGRVSFAPSSGLEPARLNP